eukprot:CAMPEP_0184650896 /NCGR_PEP_ID=MMETSP0308-20130426/8470_1 /TAXON_ID=38269 /ORGANISM="Gloeochaete witrockiana, Strain SAG 46.84" /LENGTH=115 /DNA_ID=CAMNT_0027084747 /DNA_START=28 /DNA_END=375 /DNA_ORIENTATION=+
MDSDEDDCLTEQEFLRALEKYPRIRDRTFQRVAPLAKQFVNIADISEHLPDAEPTAASADHESSLTFWDHLEKRLNGFFDPASAAAVAAAFRQEHYTYIASLNLETVEKIASCIQ